MSLYFPCNNTNSKPLDTSINDPDYRRDFFRNNFQFITYSTTDNEYSISRAKVLRGGYGYSDTTQPVFPAPDNPTGTTASGSVSLGLTYESINISGGSNHSVNDYYIIFPSGQEEDDLTSATIRISKVDESGAVLLWVLEDPGSNFNNGTPTITKITSNPDAVEADVSFNPDKFTIASISLDNEGTGYYKNNSFSHKITFSNAGSGSGCFAIADSKPEIKMVHNDYFWNDTNNNVTVDGINYARSNSSLDNYDFSITAPKITNK